MTKVINIKWGEPYDIYCGRPGHGQSGEFGNPHPIGFCKICNKTHDRKDSLEEYKKYFFTRIEQDSHFRVRILSLENKILGCFCKEKDREVECHCDTIKEYLENKEKYELKVYVGPTSNRVIIAGSRSITDYDLIKQTIIDSGFKIDEVVCGEASGVDLAGKRYALENNIPVKSFPADWNNLIKLPQDIKINKYGQKYNRLAGHNRNREMAEYSTHLISIHCNSPGSLNMLKVAKENNLTIYEKVIS